MFSVKQKIVCQVESLDSFHIILSCLGRFVFMLFLGGKWYLNVLLFTFN